MESNYGSEKLSLTQLWILALSAGLTQGNHEDHDTLYGCKKEKAAIKASHQMLRRDWGIENKEDLMDILDDLLGEGGHGPSFNRIREFLRNLSEEGQRKYLEGIPKKSDDYSRYHLVKAYDKVLPKGGIKAFDYTRYIILCRKGALIEYLSHEQAWKMMREAAYEAQKEYNSFREYGLGYIIGRQFWRNQLTEELAKNQAEYIKPSFFLKDAPWLKLDWNMTLE